MKKCGKCGEIKSLDEFHKSSSSPDGRQYRCKTCSVSAARQSALANPEAKRDADRRYRQTDKYKANRKERREGPQREHILEQKRESWYRNHESNLEKLRAREADPEFRRKQRERYDRWRKKDPRGVQRTAIRKLYGLTLEQWDAMLIGQLGCCAICRQPSMELHVDHCHATGTVRALLCQKCNHGLGLFGDNPELLCAAAQYIIKYREQAGVA